MTKFLSSNPKTLSLFERDQGNHSFFRGEKNKKDITRLMLWLGFTPTEPNHKKSEVFFYHIILSELPEYFRLYDNCYYLLSTIILPTPTRTLLHFSFISDTWEAFSRKLLYDGNNLTEKILGQQVLRLGHRKSDVGYLLYFIEKIGIIKPGRKRLFLPRKFYRAEGSNVVCADVFTRNPYKLFLLDSYLYGSQSVSPYTKIDYQAIGLEERWITNSEKYVSRWFPKTIIEFMAVIKKNLPQIVENIKNTYNAPPF